MMPRILRTVLAATALATLPIACVTADTPQAAEQNSTVRPAEALTLEGVENLHRVNTKLYRSAQPTPQGFSNLQALGVRSVLNLREYHRDTRKARHTDLHLMAYPVAAGQVTAADVENCLKLLADAPKPALVHCWHGSDRTGIVVAAWRIVYENRSVEEAEAEFRNDRYGHHEFWYGNLVELLRSTDWDAMRERLKKKAN